MSGGGGVDEELIKYGWDEDLWYYHPSALFFFLPRAVEDG